VSIPKYHRPVASGQTGVLANDSGKQCRTSRINVVTQGDISTLYTAQVAVMVKRGKNHKRKRT
jgi:hypothetical protein